MLNRIESRLDTIAKLERKYGPDIAAVLDHRDRAKEKLETLTNADEHREKLLKAQIAAEQVLRSAAERLSAARRAAAQGMTEQIGEVLRFLDMPRVHFDVRIAPIEGKETYRADGGDDVEFLISTNPGEPLLPMIRIASGGELSRIMLAIKSVLSDADGVPTVIFDEVDTGVSGKTSRKIGIKLKQIATRVQVLCVTHSAQIVSLADQHYYIYKDEVAGRTETRLRELTGEERVEEIARILGGMQVTDAQRESARELMKENW
jgi:DNA repair protein RecN (Recombination protein N)